MRSVTLRRSATMSLRGEFGITLLEMTIVVSIALVVGAFAIVNGVSASRSFRLSESATDYANLMQKARIRAVQDDRYYIVLTRAGSEESPATAFVDIAGTGTYATGDPMMVFASGVTPVPFASGPNVTNLKSQFLPAGGNAQGSVNSSAAGPTFGPRGLPCTPVTSGGYTTCPYLTPTSYITFFQNNQSQKWAAVTVTPAGRIRLWSYDGSSWSPVN